MNPLSERFSVVYANEEVPREKQAGLAPLAARVANGVLQAGLSAGRQRHAAQLEAQADEVNARARQIEQVRLGQATSALAYTPARPLLGADQGASLPAGWDAGMVRLAHAAGRHVARGGRKHAGIDLGAMMAKAKPLGLGKALGTKGNLALAGLSAAGLWAGSKAIRGAGRGMGQEAEAPATYGAGRFGAALPYGVNQYGHPQTGTPLY